MQETSWALEKAMQVLKIHDACKDEIKKQLKKMHDNNQVEFCIEYQKIFPLLLDK